LKERHNERVTKLGLPKVKLYSIGSTKFFSTPYR